VRRRLAKAAKELGVTEFTARFLFSEWTYVVDAWQLDSAKAYADVPRLGRKNRLGAKQRARLWSIFEATRNTIDRMGLHTWAQIFAEVTAYYLPVDLHRRVSRSANYCWRHKLYSHATRKLRGTR
jgi:hypothetical protein